MYNFEPFVEHIAKDSRVHVRVSDNAMDDEELWGVSQLAIIDGVVVGQCTISRGMYSIDDMIGWTIKQLVEWSSYDATGSHPEQYHEIST